MATTNRRMMASSPCKIHFETVSFRLLYDPVSGISNLGIFNWTLFHIDLQYLPEASYGLQLLLLPEFVCVCVCLCVGSCYQTETGNQWVCGTGS